MHPKTALPALLATACLAAAAPHCPAQIDLPGGLAGRTTRSQQAAIDIPATVKLIIDQTNTFRGEHKLGALRIDSRLTAAAAGFAAFLAEHGELSHEADGRHPAERARAAGYDFFAIAENIADNMKSSGFTPPELARSFVQGWEESPHHRENMLDRDVTQTGVAIAFAPATNTYYAVQMFGKPKSPEVTFRLTNKTDQPISYKSAGGAATLAPRDTVELSLPPARDISFAWPEGKAPANGKKSLRPHDGEHWLIQLDAKGRIELKKEPRPPARRDAAGPAGGKQSDGPVKPKRPPGK